MGNPLIVPNYAVRVNKSHPLTPLALYMPGVTPKDLCGNFPTLKYEAAATFRSDPSGQSLGNYADRAGAYANLAIGQQLTGAVTLFWRGIVTGPPLVGNKVFLIGLGTDTGASPTFGYSLLISATGSNLVADWTAGTTNHNYNAGVAMPTHADLSVAATFVPGGSVIAYINGASIGTAQTYGVAPTYSGTWDVIIGTVGPGGAANGLKGSSYVGMIYSRALSAAEIMRLHLAPYSMLRPIVVQSLRKPLASSTPSFVRKQLFYRRIAS